MAGALIEIALTLCQQRISATSSWKRYYTGRHQLCSVNECLGRESHLKRAFQMSFAAMANEYCILNLKRQQKTVSRNVNHRQLDVNVNEESLSLLFMVEPASYAHFAGVRRPSQ